MASDHVVALPEHGRGFCSICQNPIVPGDPTRLCEHCGASYHTACWESNRGCGTYGCKLAPEALKMEVSSEERDGGWGDAKECPNCGEVLKSSALKCKRCKVTFDTHAPLTPEDYQAQQARRAEAKRATGLAIVLFCVSALGVLAPLALALSGSWMFSRRQMFRRRAASAAELLVYGAAALSLAYVVLMIAIFGFGW